MTPHDEATLRRRGLEYDVGHAVIQTIPATVAIRTRQRARAGALVGIELSDASPHGLDQVRRERAALLEIAGDRNLAVVAASNTHGWTSTPVAWSLLRIPGWRDLTPAALDLKIQQLLRQEGRRAVRVVERYGTDAGQTAPGSPPRCRRSPGDMFATLTRLSDYRGWRGDGASTCPPLLDETEVMPGCGVKTSSTAPALPRCAAHCGRVAFLPA